MPSSATFKYNFDIITGANLASPMCHGTGFFLSLLERRSAENILDENILAKNILGNILK